ncbi:MAG TPA: glycosyltransferase [Pyrinomonadaceae bacterium]|nr:glycosyltransferase [Pyrinomonadaceae bacterium]
MRVMRIIARLNVGGPARHVVWLSKGLEEFGFETILVHGRVPEGEDSMEYLINENEIKNVYLEKMSRELSLWDVPVMLRLWKLMREFKPDIIHTHTAKAGAAGRAAAFLYKWLNLQSLIGRPRRTFIFHTFHGHIFHSYYGQLKTSVFIFIEKLLAKITDCIIVISKKQLDEIHEEFGIGKLSQYRIVRLGIELERFLEPVSDDEKAGLKKEFGIAKDEIVIAAIGRLAKIKNLELLLEAAKIIKESGDGETMKFLIVGDGEQRQKLEEKARELGLDNIEFAGNVRDISKVYKVTDIVALTSLNEGTPLSLIEAMAAGVPIIATAVGGVLDLAGEELKREEGLTICERGILVDSGNAKSFARGLIFLAENEKLRKSLSQAGKEFVEKSYSRDRLVADIAELYQSVTKRPN